MVAGAATTTTIDPQLQWRSQVVADEEGQPGSRVDRAIESVRVRCPCVKQVSSRVLYAWHASRRDHVLSSFCQQRQQRLVKDERLFVKLLQDLPRLHPSRAGSSAPALAGRRLERRRKKRARNGHVCASLRMLAGKPSPPKFRLKRWRNRDSASKYRSRSRRTVCIVLNRVSSDFIGMRLVHGIDIWVSRSMLVRRHHGSRGRVSTLTLSISAVFVAVLKTLRKLEP